MESGFRVVFVCTGNTCRSPMAAHVLIDYLSSAGLDDSCTVSSRGVRVMAEGAPMDPRAVRALTGRRIDPGDDHHVRPLQTSDVGEADLFVALDHSHADRLRELGAPSDHVLLLGGFDPESDAPVDVADPFESDQDAYGYTLTRIMRCMPGLIAEIRDRLRVEPTGGEPMSGGAGAFDPAHQSSER